VARTGRPHGREFPRGSSRCAAGPIATATSTRLLDGSGAAGRLIGVADGLTCASSTNPSLPPVRDDEDQADPDLPEPGEERRRRPPRARRTDAARSPTSRLWRTRGSGCAPPRPVGARRAAGGAASRTMGRVSPPLREHLFQPFAPPSRRARTGLAAVASWSRARRDIDFESEPDARPSACCCHRRPPRGDSA